MLLEPLTLSIDAELVPERIEPPTSRTKILFFVPHLGSGGAEMHLVRLLNHLDRDHFQGLLAVVRRGGAYESNLREGIPIHQCGWEFLPSATLRMQSAIAGLRRIVEREQPDVVLAFLDHAVAATAKALATMPHPRPLFIAGIQNNLEKWLGNLPRWSSRWLRSETISGYVQADHVIALSAGVRE